MRHIIEKVDHTLLKPTTTWKEIQRLCDEAVQLGVASVCIPPSYIKQAHEYLDGRMKICTVVGFPLGYQTTAVKLAETIEALENGADEIDMVIHQGYVKDEKYDLIESEIKALKNAVGDKVLKVIIETCYLTETEKIKLCQVVTAAGVDFIKTSTGFGTSGATLEDIQLMAEHVGSNVQIKAAGGIKSLRDAQSFIEAGATRLGTSSICNIIKDEIVTGY